MHARPSSRRGPQSTVLPRIPPTDTDKISHVGTICIYRAWINVSQPIRHTLRPSLITLALLQHPTCPSDNAWLKCSGWAELVGLSERPATVAGDHQLPRASPTNLFSPSSPTSRMTDSSDNIPTPYPTSSNRLVQPEREKQLSANRACMPRPCPAGHGIQLASSYSTARPSYSPNAKLSSSCAP